jgi:hypothetical protein
VDRSEAKTIDRVGERLKAERAAPSAELHAKLRPRISGLAAEPAADRPRRLRVLVAACLAAGLALLGVAALGISGSGPLG